MKLAISLVAGQGAGAQPADGLSSTRSMYGTVAVRLDWTSATLEMPTFWGVPPSPPPVSKPSLMYLLMMPARLRRHRRDAAERSVSFLAGPETSGLVRRRLPALERSAVRWAAHATLGLGAGAEAGAGRLWTAPRRVFSGPESACCTRRLPGRLPAHNGRTPRVARGCGSRAASPLSPKAQTAFDCGNASIQLDMARRGPPGIAAQAYRGEIWRAGFRNWRVQVLTVRAERARGSQPRTRTSTTTGAALFLGQALGTLRVSAVFERLHKRRSWRRNFRRQAFLLQYFLAVVVVSLPLGPSTFLRYFQAYPDHPPLRNV